MLKLRYFYLIFLINTISAFDQDPTYLVLNRFDRPIPEIDQSLIDNFSQSSFDFNSSVDEITHDIEESLLTLTTNLSFIDLDDTIGYLEIIYKNELFLKNKS